VLAYSINPRVSCVASWQGPTSAERLHSSRNGRQLQPASSQRSSFGGRDGEKLDFSVLRPELEWASQVNNTLKLGIISSMPGNNFLGSFLRGLEDDYDKGCKMMVNPTNHPQPCLTALYLRMSKVQGFPALGLEVTYVPRCESLAIARLAVTVTYIYVTMKLKPLAFMLCLEPARYRRTRLSTADKRASSFCPSSAVPATA
jgi:hypothetical protein